jgi:hypothetical protein
MRRDDLTPPQRRALAAVVAAGARGTTARSLALALWPDSPAWNVRTRGRTGNRNGAVGGTMPMKAGRLLRTLEEAGLVANRVGTSLWTATTAGRRAAQGGGR